MKQKGSSGILDSLYGTELEKATWYYPFDDGFQCTRQDKILGYLKKLNSSLIINL
jgi:hypothetical protein